ncbi:hypothetical protein SAMD00019534_058150 [Acytostelium subglobosum LB1]|uniref:hypothetical protein n=1 Tax=Acytostelium subglobosum LB1 TaxID=1410327 RepID=UPI000644A0B0|nr:hypothetical protein SAMD00019534_058150 [Acytostelium subglobosum LB1]GAM22640.1 hypothetical protein SAMD00019534_058150 [Acytostelium subglobosum LB1]|eukprot:XP_012754760.1 hypothetical protein SAMD00019534_058150 [Acytostelium subglobosum LB1]
MLEAQRSLSRHQGDAMISMSMGLHFISPSLGLHTLTNIRVLQLQSNKLGLSPDEIRLLPPTIHTLNLSGNFMTMLPSVALSTHLPLLTSLDISANNRFQSITITSHQHETLFPKLEMLNVSSCEQLTNLTINNTLPSLNTLLVSCPNIERSAPLNLLLPRLPRLATLHLASLGISKLSIDFSMMTALKDLDVSKNNLTQLPPSIGELINLTHLHIHGNSIEELPASMSKLDRLVELDLMGNPIHTPMPEVLAQGAAAVVRFLKDLSKGHQSCYRMKLLVVGQENVGKTTLLKVLRDKKKAKKISSEPNISTDGIVIDQWNLCAKASSSSSSSSTSTTSKLTNKVKLKSAAKLSSIIKSLSSNSITTSFANGIVPGGDQHPIQLTTMDFAGQEIYYSTHQFFLSERSIYLVLWDARLPEEESRVEFWLQSIMTHAPRSPVIIVGTHLDSISSSEAKSISRQMELKYLGGQSQSFNMSPNTSTSSMGSTSSTSTSSTSSFNIKYPSVQAIAMVSCSTGKDIGTLNGIIEEVARAQPTMGEQLPSAYLLLEKMIAEERHLRPIPTMPWSEMVRLGAMSDINDEQELTRAVSLLHLLGAVVYFPNEAGLKNMVIVDPQWITMMLSTIVTAKKTYASQGIIHHRDLVHVWKSPGYPRELHQHLLKLLEKFDVAFNIPSAGDDAGKSLIPSMLPKACPTDFESTWIAHRMPAQYGRHYQFAFIPSGFFSRLMVRILYITQGQAKVYWRDGILLSKDNEFILLELVSAQKLIRFTVRGTGMSSTAELSRVIIETIQSLLEHSFKQQADTQVSVPCTHCLQDGDLDTPHLFGLNQCEKAVLDSQPYVSCPKSSAKVRTDSLVPDLSMLQSHTNRITKSEVQAILDEGKMIGQGGTAKVYKGMYHGEVVACKVLNTRGDDERVTEREISKAFAEFRRECWVMSTINHPNTVKMLGLCLEPLSILTEFLTGGDLHDYLANHRVESQRQQKIPARLDWRLCLSLALDIANGMAFLHSLCPPMVHRDLKTPNVLLCHAKDGGLVAKVSDFGLSGPQFSMAKKCVMNPVWLAPEVINGGESTVAGDVYAFGVIIWELFTCDEYFGDVGAFMSLLEDRVKAGERPPIPSDCHPSYQRLIEQCWDNDPSVRPSFNIIVNTLKIIINERA